MIKFLILTFSLLLAPFAAAQDRVLRDVNTIIMKEPSPGSNTATYVQQSLAASLTFNLPVADGTNGQVLSTNGSGDLSWSTVATVPVNATTDITGILPLAAGGTSKSLSAVNGGVLWTDSNSVEVSAAGTAGQLLLSGGAATPTWSNTVDGLIVDNGLSIIEEVSLTSPSAGQRKLGLKTDGKLYLRDSSGNEKVVGEGSAGGINYILNPDAETDTTGWSTYADAAGTSPVGGAGGSPTITWTRTTSSPLRGLGSFLFTKDASNRQGEGFAYSFTVDAADRARVMQIEFDYTVASGTFVAGSFTDTSTAGDSDVTIWVYDVTNGIIIQPSTHRLYGTSGPFVANFQTDAVSTSYRLIGHVGRTGTSAFTLKLDNLSVGPAKYSYGTPISDWKAGVGYTSNVTTNAALNVMERRVGDSLELRARWAYSGASSSGELLNITMPYTADTRKMVFKANNEADVAHGSYLDNGVAAYYGYNGVIVSSSPTIIRLQTQGQSSSTQVANAMLTNGGLPSTPGSGDSVYVETVVGIPIVGWSSSRQMSDGFNNRDVSAGAYRTGSNQTITAGSDVEVVFNTKKHDTTTSYSTSTGRFTAPVSGKYQVSYGMSVGMGATAATDVYAAIKKNGTGSLMGYSRISDLTSSKVYTMTGLTEVDLVAGDYVSLFINATTNDVGVLFTGSTNEVSHFFVSKVPSSQTIMAGERISAIYALSASTANASVADNADETLDFDTKIEDTHGAVTTGASWSFRAPAPRTYEVCANIEWANTTNLTSTSMRVRKNSSQFAVLWRGGADIYLAGCLKVPMLKGDTLDVQAYQDDSASGARSLTTSTVRYHLSVVAVGP